MKKTTTSERLKTIMKNRQLRQVDILKACEPYCVKYGVKIARNDLSQYVSGKVQPGQDKLTILAKALEVSEVWLMGYDVQVNQHTLPNNVSDLIEDIPSSYSINMSQDKGLIELITKFQKLDSLDRAKIIERVDVMLENEKYAIK